MKTTDNRNDTDLLQAYGRDGDESAFEALAGRHVDMIFAVSLRRSGNRQLAEEATQNVLLGLSRKARKLSAQEKNLTGWLHKSTRFEVSKLLRRESRIKAREQAYASDPMKTSTEGGDEAFQRLYPLLDQAIDHLRAPDREVIVRRYLEGQNFGSIGKALGISEDTAQKRTSRAFERLNQFFRRRVGVTVSATALAAGISRHCLEAAPASCLQIAGQVAPAGMASILTTVTIMSITKTIAVAAGTVAVAGGIAFLATRDDDPPETVNTPPPRTESTAVPETTATVEPSGLPVTADAGPAATNADTFALEEQLGKQGFVNPHPGKDEFAQRLGAKHERLLEDLKNDLGLTASQSDAVKQGLDARVEAFRAALDEGPQPGDSGQESMQKEEAMTRKAGGIIRGEGLRQDLVEILSEDQLAAFDKREALAWQAQVESHAYTEFSKLTPILGLTEEQKDRTFERLQASSAEVLNADADVRAFLALQKGQTPTQMDLTHPGDMDFITEALQGESPLTPGSPEFNRRAIEVVGGRIETQIELLAPVLDERQTQRYRDHLVGQSVLKDFGIELPTPEEP